MHIRRPALILALASALAACASVAPPPGVTAIGVVQGNGPTSPMLGRDVTVEGVVTANFAAGLGLWALQGASDHDDATSDALFLTGVGGPLLVGDHVRVRGRVAERDTEKDASITVLEVSGLTPLAPMPLPSARSGRACAHCAARHECQAGQRRAAVAADARRRPGRGDGD